MSKCKTTRPKELSFDDEVYYFDRKLRAMERGKMDDTKIDEEMKICSHCGLYYDAKFEYCPECGCQFDINGDSHFDN